jgi:hypothetical protein
MEDRGSLDEEIERLIEERLQARKAKNSPGRIRPRRTRGAGRILKTPRRDAVEEEVRLSRVSIHEILGFFS